LKKNEFPSPKDVPFQISMHSGQWFMRRSFLEHLSKFSLFCPFIWTNSEYPSPKHVSYQVWMKLAKWFFKRSRLKKMFTSRQQRI